MTSRDEPLHLGNEVEMAVIYQGLPDFQLAHGASLVADPSQHRTFFGDERVALRQIYGVTAVSLDSAGETSFRTATFGARNNAFVNQIEAVGTNGVIDLGTSSGQYPRLGALVNSNLMLRVIFDEVGEPNGCTLGGIIVIPGEKKNTLTTRPFISETYAQFAEKMSARRIVKVADGIRRLISPTSKERRKTLDERGIDPITTQTIGNFLLMSSRAKKRPGGPVVVERPFLATV